MVICKPKSLFSNSYLLSGSIPETTLDFAWFSESGIIRMGSQTLEISKDGLFSGRWHLLRNGTPIIKAQKASAFRRSIEIFHENQTFLLKARSAFGRSMTLTGPNVNATIVPAHPFTRRATISGNLPTPELTAFTFWLTALLWKRARNNSNNSNNR